MHAALNLKSNARSADFLRDRVPVSIYIEYVHARPESEAVLLQLSVSNHFTAADLEANRRGRVGLDQLRYHLKEALTGPLFVLGAGLAASFLVRLAYAAYVEKHSVFTFLGDLIGYLVQGQFHQLHEAYFSPGGERLPIIVMGFVLTAPALAWKKLRYLPFLMMADLLAGRVQREEGGVAATTDEKKAPGRAGKKGETITEYFYEVNGKKLSVSAEAHRDLTMGLRYRVYYLANSRMVLSIEPLLG